MFRSIAISDNAAPIVREDVAPDGLPGEGVLTWVDLISPTEADLALLGARFGFHPLALEDCAHADQRPKHEEYGGYSFIVNQGFDWDGEGELRWHELHAFLGPSYLVTVHDAHIPGLHDAWRRVLHDPSPLARGVDFLYYVILDQCVDHNFPILDRIGDELENLEDTVIFAPTKQCLSRIFTMKGHLSLMRKVLSPQRDVLALLARRGDARVSEKTAPYFRDVLDHMVRIIESIDSNRDLLSNALDAYMSSNGQRTNEVMKALAIMSAVFMPLTFITGFFGQNFEHLPFGSDALMYSMIGACLLSPVLLLLWFKSRHWF
ncbi:MAG: magnesium/cobalt transporter CorA [Polyangiales bacterium]